MIRIYTCSFKGMTRKYLGHRFKNYQHRKWHFNELMQETVYIFRHRTCCIMQINQFYMRLFGSFGWCMPHTVIILDTMRHLPCLCWMVRHRVVRSASKNGRSEARYRQWYWYLHVQRSGDLLEFSKAFIFPRIKKGCPRNRKSKKEGKNQESIQSSTTPDVWSDSLSPINNISVIIWTVLPGLNQYYARINVSCSRTPTQWHRWGSSPGLDSSTIPLSHCAPTTPDAHVLGELLNMGTRERTKMRGTGNKYNIG